jgi:regulator of protease activity HflC (stomatin/prohibitin superfamily)
MKKIPIVLSILTVGLAACGVLPGHVRIKPGYVGIKVEGYGSSKGVQNVTLATGDVAYNPLTEQVFQFPTFEQNYVWTKDTNEQSPLDESITFNSAEGIVINADINVQFAFIPDKIPVVFQAYRQDADEITKTIIRSQVRDVINTAASKRKLTEIFGSGKGEMLAEIKQTLNQRLEKQGIRFDLITFVNALRVDAAVQQSLNETVNASFKAAEAQNRLKEAEINLQIAKVKAQENQVTSKSLTPQILQNKALEKWNGILPQSTSGMPFLQFPSNNSANK